MKQHNFSDIESYFFPSANSNHKRHRHWRFDHLTTTHWSLMCPGLFFMPPMVGCTELPVNASRGHVWHQTMEDVNPVWWYGAPFIMGRNPISWCWMAVWIRTCSSTSCVDRYCHLQEQPSGTISYSSTIMLHLTLRAGPPANLLNHDRHWCRPMTRSLWGVWYVSSTTWDVMWGPRESHVRVIDIIKHCTVIACESIFMYDKRKWYITAVCLYNP